MKMSPSPLKIHRHDRIAPNEEVSPCLSYGMMLSRQVSCQSAVTFASRARQCRLPYDVIARSTENQPQTEMTVSKYAAPANETDENGKVDVHVEDILVIRCGVVE